MRELSVILVNMIAAGTPILYALLGDMVSQRAGVISLSVEGSMLVGACIGFGVAYSTNSMISASLPTASPPVYRFFRPLFRRRNQGSWV